MGEFLNRKGSVIFFALLLLIGALIFDDYGVPWDDAHQRNIGLTSYNYVFNDDDALLSFVDRHYGVGIELPLILIEKAFGLTDSRVIYLTRHLITFLVYFASVVVFHRICLRRFGSEGWALLGSAFLVLSPRIFADAFFNTKDLVFMSAMIFAAASMLRMLDKRTPGAAVLHGLVCAWAINVRVMAVMIVVFTVFYFAMELAIRRPAKREAVAALKHTGLFIAVLAVGTVIQFPYLWDSPVNRFLEVFAGMSSHPWGGTVLYFGEYISARLRPPFYPITWICMTTPILYLAAAVVGALKILDLTVKDFRLWSNDRNHRNDLIFLACFVSPIIAVIALQSTLYDGWRQLYFVYPFLLLVSLRGIHFAKEELGRRFPSGARSFSRPLAAGCAAIALSLTTTAFSMLRNHPHQNVFFNVATPRGDEWLRANFGLDHQGLSYRQALEFVIATDPSEDIAVAVPHEPGFLNMMILPAEDRQRIRHVDNVEQADYFIGTYRWKKDGYPYPNPVHSIVVHGSQIVTVFKLDRAYRRTKN